MVRIVTQNFSPQRSRHSSGETDKYLAERASSALGLSAFSKKKFDLPECESSSDSFWDSELDGDHQDAVHSECCEDNDINGNQTLNHFKKSNVQTKRTERRRERNKLSAQAYRQRRRSKNMEEQQEMNQLETENKRLQTLVETLESTAEQTRQYLRGCPVPMPEFLMSAPGAAQPMAACSAAAPPSPSTSATAASPTVSDSSPHSNPGHHQNHLDTQHHLSGDTNTSTLSSVPVKQEPLSPTPRVHQKIRLDAPRPPVANMNLSSTSSNQPQGGNENPSPGLNITPPTPAPSYAPQHTQLRGHQIIVNVNTNALMCASQHSNQAPTTFTAPAFMAIPVECNPQSGQRNLNLNMNPHTNSPAAVSPASGSARAFPNSFALGENNGASPASASPPLLGTLMLSLNGNPPPSGALYGYVNVEVCSSNGNINSNTAANANVNSSRVNHVRDNPSNTNANGNGACYNFCKNNNGAVGPSAPVTVNLNEVKMNTEPLQWQAQRHYSQGTH